VVPPNPYILRRVVPPNPYILRRVVPPNPYILRRGQYRILASTSHNRIENCWRY
jgi:hypothetical protein